MNYWKIFQISLLLFTFNCSIGQKPLNLKIQEKECLKIFYDFKKYIVLCLDKQADISDTLNVKHVLLNYIVSEPVLDSLDKTHFKKDEISEERLKSFISEFRDFYQYFFEKRKLNLAEHLSAIPIRLSSDKCMYEKLIPFQQQNTFVYFDDRHPEKILGYMLFIPKLKNMTSAPRIWSWTLQFEAGYWAFRSPMGTVGIEYFISEGVKGPEHPIGN